MRRGSVLLLLAAAACGEGGRAASVEAARADSSAAGYAVGRRGDSARPETATVAAATPVLPNGETTRPVTTATGVDVRTDSGTKPHPSVVAGRAAGATAPHGPVTGRVAESRRDSSGHADTGRTRVPNVPVKVPRTDSTAPAAPPSGPVRVNEFLTYDARSRTVSLQLIAGYNGLNGSLNYNGAINGSHGLIVPTGWRIHVAVTNRDSDLQHSAIVIAKVLPPPIEPADPAFAGAALTRLDEGLQEDETGSIDFVATRPGHFMIACGVPGHAQAGEWLELVVTNSALPPTYR